MIWVGFVDDVHQRLICLKLLKVENIFVSSSYLFSKFVFKVVCNTLRRFLLKKKILKL